MEHLQILAAFLFGFGFCMLCEHKIDYCIGWAVYKALNTRMGHMFFPATYETMQRLEHLVQRMTDREGKIERMEYLLSEMEEMEVKKWQK